MDIPLPAEPLDPRAQAMSDRRRFWTAALISAGFAALLWWIRMLEVGLGHSLGALGVRPGEISGLVGIISGPMIHGSTKHLVANTLPMFVLGTLMLAVYPRAALRSIALIWLLSGLGIWLFGRPSSHIGASGLSHGLMFALFVLGLLRRDRAGIAAALIAFFLYGGMLLTVLPGDPQISWEAHLFGAASGVLAALLWRKRDPIAARRRYSWEDEEDGVSPLQDELAAHDRAVLEPPPPSVVPVLWHRAEASTPTRGVVLPFRTRSDGDGGSQNTLH